MTVKCKAITVTSVNLHGPFNIAYIHAERSHYQLNFHL